MHDASKKGSGRKKSGKRSFPFPKSRGQKGKKGNPFGRGRERNPMRTRSAVRSRASMPEHPNKADSALRRLTGE